MSLPVGVRYNEQAKIFWLPRSNEILEKWLDRRYRRINGSLKWMYAIDEAFNPIDSLRDVLSDYESCYMVGKGKSLNYISSDYFENETVPIFCMNHAIHIVEGLGLPNPLYCCIQDTNSQVTVLDTTTIICHVGCCMDFAGHENLYYHEMTPLGHPTSAFTVNLLKDFGLEHIDLISFDYTANGESMYATIEGVHTVHNIQMSDALSNKLKTALKDVVHSFITPTSFD